MATAYRGLPLHLPDTLDASFPAAAAGGDDDDNESASRRTLTRRVATAISFIRRHHTDVRRLPTPSRFADRRQMALRAGLRRNLPSRLRIPLQNYLSVPTTVRNRVSIIFEELSIDAPLAGYKKLRNSLKRFLL